MADFFNPYVITAIMVLVMFVAANNNSGFAMLGMTLLFCDLLIVKFVFEGDDALLKLAPAMETAILSGVGLAGAVLLFMPFKKA